jgi:adenine-specific DNA-methyltransferase
MEVNKLDGQTRDVVSDNLAALKQAFPEVVVDGKVDLEKLKLLLGDDVDDTEERYSFTWPGKRDAIKLAISRNTGTLRPDKANSKDWDTTKNLFIEGDNLEVLRILQNSYRGKVKMIYIDPPYNTGKDFVYKDDFKDNLHNYKEQAGLTGQSNPETAGRYHTNWLNMMYPRLRLAKNLLKDDGVIFISIDDHEVHNLRKICDEIFGEDQFITSIIWHNNKKGRQMDLHIKGTNESVLVYARDINKVLINSEKDEIDVTGMEHDGTSYYVKDYPLHNGTSEFHINNRPNLAYTIYYNPKSEDAKVIDEKVGERENFRIDAPSLEGLKLIENGYFRILPKFNEKYNNQRVWRWGQEKFLDEYKTELLFLQEEKGYYIYQKKRYGDDGEFEKKYKNYFDVDGGVAKGELYDVLGLKVFENPKPTSLIKEFLKISTNKDSVVLDFFAGSASTAHATVRLNAEDGGSRRFIMVQIPESTPEDSEARKAKYKTIAEISRERIRRAGEKIKQDYADTLKDREEPLDIGFKAFTLDTTNFREWDSNTTDLNGELLAALETFKDGRTSEDALYEVLLKYGVDLSEPAEVLTLDGKQVYSLAGNYLLVCLEKKITLATIEAMAALKPARVVCYDEGFESDEIKQNALETLKRAGVEDVRVI